MAKDSSVKSQQQQQQQHHGGGGLFGRKKNKTTSTTPSSSSSAAVAAAKSSSPPTTVASPSQRELHAKAKAVIEAKQQQKQQQQQNESTPKSSSSPQTSSSSTSWLARTRYFQQMSEWAFQVIDVDKSGHVDEKELYSGLLLIHLKLGTYAGPAACKPISLERCHEVFVKMDKDKSGSLDKDEFQQVMMVLFSNVLIRVVFQYAATIALVPILGQYMVNALGYIFFALSTAVSQILWEFGTKYDLDILTDPSSVLWDPMVTWITNKLPDVVLKYYDVLQTHVDMVLDYIPDSIWETLPITLASTVLGILVVPWSLMKIDDFFQSLADRNVAKSQTKE